MSNDPKCPKCERELPSGSPEGLCPRCLLSPTISDVPDDMQFPPMEEMARFFPNLEILEPIGHGGFGIVYKVRQPNLNRYAALKVIRPSLCDKPGFAERFKREAQALTELKHPNIVDVYDFDEHDGMWYLLMEYVDGSSLRELMTAKEFPPRRLELVTQVCDALQFAHDKGVVHRDIKPENILVGEGGKVKIVDFGLIKYAIDDPTQLTVTGTTMGTPYYMAPEQLSNPSKVDHRADIYSLGVVIYELLTGELPLGRWDPPSHRAEVDVHLDEVVLRSLEKEPERRYQRASDLKEAVNEAGRSKAHTEQTNDVQETVDSTDGMGVSLKIVAILCGLAATAAGHFVAFGFAEGICNELLGAPRWVCNFSYVAGEGLFSVIAIVVIFSAAKLRNKLSVIGAGLVAFAVFMVALPVLGRLLDSEVPLMITMCANVVLLTGMFLTFFSKPRPQAAPLTKENSAVLPMSRKGKQLAVWGVVLQLGAVLGLVYAVVAMTQAYRGFADVGAGLPDALAQEISRALVPVTVGVVSGLVGTILILVAFFRFRYRAPWFHTVLWVLSILWLFCFPVGTVLGFIVIIHLLKHKDEFTGQAPAGGLPSKAPKPQATVKVTTLVAAAALVACLVYLMACGVFALRPISPGGTETSSMTFTFHGSMEDALAECAAELRKQYGTSITVDVEGKTLTYRISFPTPAGYDDVTDTITLSEDVRFGQGSCKLTSHLVVKKRPASLLIAPLHYLIHRTRKPQSGDIARYLKHKLSQMAHSPELGH